MNEQLADGDMFADNFKASLYFPLPQRPSVGCSPLTENRWGRRTRAKGIAEDKEGFGLHYVIRMTSSVSDAS